MPATSAHAATPSNLIVVGNHQPSCGTHDSVVIANATTGAKVSEPGKPFPDWGPLNDVKPFENNNKIIGLWASHADGRKGGVGIYDRVAGTWSSFPLPTTLNKGGPHSVAVLPGPLYAVAHVGGITGTSVNGAVLLFDKNGALLDTEGLGSAHGVEWDPKRWRLYAVGYSHIKSYDLRNGLLEPDGVWSLPGTQNGHDIRRRRTDTRYLVTGNDTGWLFNPDVTTGAFTQLTDNGTALGGGVKSLDQGFDGATLKAYWKLPEFHFLNRAPQPTSGGFCLSAYKYRWIWSPGDPTFPEETPQAPPPATTQPAEPFLWAKKWVKTDSMPPVDDMWLGLSTKTSADAAYNAIMETVGNGNIPFIKFYQWGDSGPKKMSEFQYASDSMIAEWERYAQRMANAIRDSGATKAYIVLEPEYDTNLAAACTDKFELPMRRIVQAFKTTAPQTVTINQSAFWANDPKVYDCYKDTGKEMHAQGFLTHISNTDDRCTWRTAGHDSGPNFPGGDTRQGALDSIVKRVHDKAKLVMSTFGSATTYLSDLAVTSCEWDIQDDLIQKIADAIPVNSGPYSLHRDVGLRGVVIRDYAPDEHERYLGVNNEGGFLWTSSTATVVENEDDDIQAYLRSISGTTTTTFHDVKAATPASVGVNQAVPVDLTITNSGGSLANGNVKVEVRNSANAIVGSTTFSASWSTGQSVYQAWTWAGTPTAGTYTIHVGVFSSDWATQYEWTTNAGTFTVTSTAPPAFTSSAAASPATIAPGGTTSVTATVNNSGSALSNGVVEVAVHTPNGNLAHQQAFTANIASGGSATYTTSWTTPPEAAGRYAVSVTVSGAGGTPEYHTNAAATHVDVGPSRFTSTGSVSRAGVVPGGTTRFTANVTNGGATVSGAAVSLEVYNAAGTRVGQLPLEGQTLLGAGATTTFTYDWATTSTTPKGQYTFKIGVFASGWTPLLHWNDSAAGVTVGDPAVTTAVDATPAILGPGATGKMTLTVNNTGGSIDNANVAVEVYNSAGTRVAQIPTNGLSGQSFLSGETKQYTWSWTAPTTTGTYTVKAGVWNAGWTSTYHYNNNADTVTVKNPTFTSSARVSSSTVAVGGQVTITASFTNTGGALTNGNTAIEVYNAAGTRVHQEPFPGQSIDTGATSTNTYTWTPLSSGTYTVKLGVWSTSWGTTHHWNNGAATIGVGSTAFQPSFQVGEGASNWWVEVYTSNDVTGVDVIGDDGRFYLSLTKRSWGAWAATPPSELPAGDLVRFIARRSTDGATAGSNNFFWLQAQPTTDPGWVATITKGSGSSTSWVEATVSPTASSVEVKAGTGAFTALTYSSTTGKWGKAMTVPAGTKVVFRATNSAGARAYSTVMTW